MARLALGNRTYARAIAWWGARLAEALQHAHDRGVLHRDIKPSNVLVTAAGLPMLLDFNLAHDPRAEADGAAASRLGGTLAYMAPEHLEAMIAGQADRVDHRSDLYALGMVLFEALGGQPLPPPSFTGGVSAADGLRRLVAARRAGPPRFPEGHRPIPAELEAVLRHCLAPDPSGRFATAAELAADLQAVADDAPLRGAHEPLPSRSVRWVRRNRWRLALSAPILLVLVLFNVAQFRAQAARIRREDESRQWSMQGERSMAAGEFGAAVAQFTTAAGLIQDRPDLQGLRAGLLGRLREAIAAREIRARAEALSRHAEPLRFRLLGFGGDRGVASRDLSAALEPFGVLDDPSWTRRPGLDLLDAGRRALLLEEIDELLFIWVVALATDQPDDPEMARRAVAICGRAPAAAAVRAPWQALRAWWGTRPGPAPPAIPADPAQETSARACFQWSLLATLARDRGAARLWLERATQLRPDHYWSWFALAYHDAASGDIDRALARYDVAVALRPASPWVRFNRAQLSWSRGGWGRALDDLDRSLTLARGSGFDEAEARVERGRVRQAIGDVVRARADFDAVIASSPSGQLARAARLDRAKLDADAGFTMRARAAYDALLTEDPADRSARRGRALLALRRGQAMAAEADLDLLLRDAPGGPERAELLALRAATRLVLARPADAAADAAAALRIDPSPTAVRTWARAELADGRVPDMRLLLPDELDRWPVGGTALIADLRRAVGRLRPAAERDDAGTAGTDRLSLALLLSALGEHPAAEVEADRAVDSSPDPVEALTIRARIRRRAGDASGSRADVERGLTLRPDDPRLLELRGRLEIEAGELAVGLADLDRALFFGAGGSACAARARARMVQGRPEEALDDWSHVLADDPDDPGASLERARVCLRLRLWDQALADLERASGGAAAGSPVFGRVTRTYAACLLGRPDRLPRVIALALRHGAARLMPGS